MDRDVDPLTPWRQWLIWILFAFACLNALLAIVYSHRPAPDNAIALQDKDIWQEATLFAALWSAAAFLLIPTRRALTLAAAIVLVILGLLSLGDLANARDMTSIAIGVLFLVGNLVGSTCAMGTTVAAVVRRGKRS